MFFYVGILINETTAMLKMSLMFGNKTHQLFKVRDFKEAKQTSFLTFGDRHF